MSVALDVLAVHAPHAFAERARELVRSPSESLRTSAIRLLAAVNDLPVVAAQALVEKASLPRAAAVEALGDMPGAEAESALVRAATDDRPGDEISEWVCRAFADALLRHPSLASLGALETLRKRVLERARGKARKNSLREIDFAIREMRRSLTGADRS